MVGDLRTALTRPVGATRRAPKSSLRRVLERLADRRPELRLRWEEGTEVPADIEPLAQAVLAEALRNADRHSEPEAIEVSVFANAETFTLAIENDGVRGGRDTKGGGLGLRLAALEALRYEGLVEFGPLEGGRWRVRLLVPVED